MENVIALAVALLPFVAVLALVVGAVRDPGSPDDDSWSDALPV
jgi:hypothetical protein